MQKMFVGHAPDYSASLLTPSDIASRSSLRSSSNWLDRTKNESEDLFLPHPVLGIGCRPTWNSCVWLLHSRANWRVFCFMLCLHREHCVNSGMRHRSDCTTSHCYCYCGADAKSGLIGRVMTGRVFGIRSLGHSLSGHFQCACWQWTRGQDQHGVVLWKVPPEATWKSRTANCSGASSATLSWRKGSKMNFLLFCLWPCFSSSCLSFKYYCCVKVQARVLLVVHVLKVVGKPMIWWWCVQWRKWLEIFMLHCCVATKLHVHMSFSCFYCRLTNNVGSL